MNHPLIMTVSAIILTRGRFDCLSKAIDSIRRQSNFDRVQMIVVDNDSHPPLPELPADVKVLRFEQNIGACAGRNAGVRAVSGDLLLFLDDDAEFVSDTDLQRGMAWFEARPNLGVVGFRQLTSEGKTHYMQPASSEVPVLTGFFFSYGCLVRREAFDAAGGFNEELGFYHEEVELSLRLFAAGFETIYDPTIKVVHHQDELHRDWQTIHRLSTRNALLTYLLHYPSWMLPFLFTKRLQHFARLTSRRVVPRLADLWWLSASLVSRIEYLLEHRRSLTSKAIRAWHKLSKGPKPISTS